MELGNVKVGEEPLSLSLLSFLLSLGRSPWAEFTDVFYFPNLKPSPRCLETELLVLCVFSTNVDGNQARNWRTNPLEMVLTVHT